VIMVRRYFYYADLERVLRRRRGLWRLAGIGMLIMLPAGLREMPMQRAIAAPSMAGNLMGYRGVKRDR
jgi:hypothetical protein